MSLPSGLTTTCQAWLSASPSMQAPLFPVQLMQPLVPRSGVTTPVERVALFGGDLAVGARPGGGLRVAARLPLEP